MNKVVKWIGIVLAIIVVVGLVLPNDVDIRRSVEIDGSISDIHQYVNDLEKWPAWSPWVNADPTMKTSLGEIHSGVGASQSWQGESGSGQLTITESSVDKGIVYDMKFEGDPGVYQAGISYQSKGQNVVVTWYMTGEMKPIIIGNYFALLMDALVGGSFEQGLNMLKNEVEKNQ